MAGMVHQDGIPPALEIRGLSKSYRHGLLQRRGPPVLRDVTLTAPQGEIFGYLGPNGSGKTTTLKIVFGLLSADTGTIRVLGRAHDDRSWRSRVGFLPEQPYFYDYLTAWETLDYVGRLLGVPADLRRRRGEALLEQVGLARWMKTPLRRFSKGMVQRFGIAQALIGDPELVFLDEPMSGLDPIGRRQVRNLILDLKGRRKTVFFSTHILSDAETLCDSVALLRAGELLKVGRLDEILRLDVSHMEVLLSGLGETALSALPVGVVGRHALGERWRLEVAEASLGAIVGAVEAAGGRILSVQPVRQSLEEYFFKEMGMIPGQVAWTVDA